jgi:predicted nucleic acid-binding protein
MPSDCVIVDTNIVFRFLCAGRIDLRDRLNPTESVRFFSPLFTFVELFKHKERLCRASVLSEEQLLVARNALINRLEFVNETNVPLGIWMEARRLCRSIDDHDIPFVALTLHLDGLLWTDDDALKSRLRARGFQRFFESLRPGTA